MFSPGRIRHHKPLRFAGEAPGNDPILLAWLGLLWNDLGRLPLASPDNVFMSTCSVWRELRERKGQQEGGPPAEIGLGEGRGELPVRVVYGSRSVEEGGETDR